MVVKFKKNKNNNNPPPPKFLTPLQRLSLMYLLMCLFGLSGFLNVTKIIYWIILTLMLNPTRNKIIGFEIKNNLETLLWTV